MKRTPWKPICYPVAGLLCLLLVLHSPTTFANGFDVFGAGARGAATGNSGVTTATDYTAVHYNPASLVLGPSSFGGGLVLTYTNIGIRLADRPAGYDIPDLGASGPAVGSSYRLRTRRDLEGADPGLSLFFGGTIDLGIEDLRIAAMASFGVINSSAQQSVFNDERQQYFSNQLQFDLLGGRIEHSVVLLGAAYKILDWLSVGAGVSFMPSATTKNIIYMDNITDQSNIDLNVDLEIGSRFRPHAGILVQPVEDVRLGASFRDEQMLALGVENEVQARGLQGGENYPFSQVLDLNLQFSPRQFLWGASYHQPDWMVTGEVTYVVWSRYRSSHGEDAGFSDTLNSRIGGEYNILDNHTVRAGFAYEPTPVGPQTGRSNYVDNDRFIASAGMGHVVSVGENQLRIDWHVQFQALAERTELKDPVADYPACAEGVTTICDEVPDDSIDPSTGQPWPEAAGLQTGNPGFPGFTSGGWIVTTGVQATWEF